MPLPLFHRAPPRDQPRPDGAADLMSDSTPTIAHADGRRAVALAFEDVSFSYPIATGKGDAGTRAAIVRGVTLRVAAGEMVGLLGPNGAGKSTLLKLATGIMQPQAGRIRVEGDDLRRLRREEIARRIAVVPQDFSVQFAYTVRQVVELGRTPYLGAWGAVGQTDRAAVAAALATTGCAELADRVFNELSGGERQRIIIALALAQQPHILLLDEPTAHLDIRYQIETLALVRRLNREQGLTVLATMHDLNLAARYFPRLLLFDGAVVADGAPTAVLDAAALGAVYQTPVRVGILRGDERLSVTPADDAPPPRAPAISRPIAAHLIGGSGSAAVLMRALADASLPFTIGPLTIGDSDHTLAQGLATATLMEPPFAAVSPEGLAAARAWMAAACAIIICPTPLGPGAVALLDAALAALRAGTPVALLADSVHGHFQAHTDLTTSPFPPFVGRGDAAEDATPPSHTSGKGARGLGLPTVAARDYTGRGVAAYQALLDAGAVWADSPTEALAWLAS